MTSLQIGWIGGSYLCMFGSIAGQTVFISLFGAAIREEFNISAGEYGLIYTVATLCSATALFFLGPLTDRFSPRAIGIVSSLGLALTCMIISVSGSVEVLSTALIGLRFFGQGMLPHNCATALTRWFSHFRGRALALSQLGYSTGEAILPVLVTLAIAAWGWRSVWQFVALFIALVLIPTINVLFREREMPPPPSIRCTGEHSQDDRTWTRSKVLRDGLFWWMQIGILANSGIFTLIVFHQANLIETKGWSTIAFSASFPILSITGAIAGMVGGTLVDRYGAWRLLPYLLLPLSLASLTLWLGSSEWTIALFFVLTGTGVGVLNGTANVIWAELYGTAHLGAIRAQATAGMVFASAVGPGLAGLLIDFGMPLEQQCLWYGIYCGAASLVFFILKPRMGRRVAETLSS